LASVEVAVLLLSLVLASVVLLLLASVVLLSLASVVVELPTVLLSSMALLPPLAALLSSSIAALVLSAYWLSSSRVGWANAWPDKPRTRAIEVARRVFFIVGSSDELPIPCRRLVNHSVARTC